MATLIVEQAGKRTGGEIPRRVLIGRLPTNGVFVKDTAVSRLHAWIESAGGRFVLRDCGSLVGTFVNGQPVAGPVVLANGDKIAVGSARLYFRDPSRLPSGVLPVDLGGRKPKEPNKYGLVFDCPCGAPQWAKPEDAGAGRECPHCRRVLIVPPAFGATAALAPMAVPDDPPAGQEQDSLAARPFEPVSQAAEPDTPSGEDAAPDEQTAGTGAVARFAPDPSEAAAERLHFGADDDDFACPLGEDLNAPGPRAAAAPVRGGAGAAGAARGPGADVDEWPGEDGPAPDEAFDETGPSYSLADEDEADPGVDAARAEPSHAQPDAPAVRRGGGAAPRKTRTCSICQNAIGPAEAETTCPECGLTFHADCWRENLGCSAYGCSQVNILKGDDPARETGSTASADAGAESFDEDADDARFPWEAVLLAVSVFATLAGALTFGGPPALAALVAGVYALRHRGRRRNGVVVLAAVVGVVGVLAGIVTSWYWWYGQTPWGHFRK